jgi:hypothetical protein
MTNWVPEGRLEPAVGHAAHRFRGIGYRSLFSRWIREVPPAMRPQIRRELTVAFEAASFNDVSTIKRSQPWV